MWDNLNVHRDARLRDFIDTHDWITAFFLPPYAPDLNPVEGVWSVLGRSSQASTAFTDPDHLCGPCATASARSSTSAT
ncbi:transposase [Streptomyces sp. SCUT-3]|uniref:transposase n=1 Tax=Streptomyces sp. SCUT-3 TaxID=2684469 RepID=UPI0026B5C68B